MDRRDLEASWARTRSHLAAAVAILVAHETAPPDLGRYYSCDGLDIVREGSKAGSYDPETGVVTWGDVEYE